VEVHDDRGAGLGEAPGDTAPDPTRGAGDHHDPPAEVEQPVDRDGLGAAGIGSGRRALRHDPTIPQPPPPVERPASIRIVCAA